MGQSPCLQGATLPRSQHPELLNIGVCAGPIEVHVGGCYTAGKRHRAITREQAIAALADGIRARIHCRPDTELAVL
ncbi:MULTISPECIES: DUF6233 domain-containing protein [unclassified Streptomyces]|uniref:DUF6233 domain-containing protein n=1 Tax=unclassified Streptomyces TaxID=2593676 RepID=UPI002DDA4CEC|nr:MULTISPECIES: DUF6233 domain-containing protein [unclassified Streptomyces]WSC36093.1 DUF6233 domain-containing protein [Streptomyces sp. NBC_01763]WSC56825.1 DUF6233 domain-containing protein [Streptomyces sp. NBC_01761]WSF87667.1 DUF6233 domain-containing protein [Streptomyces sp. NBC_01744]